ncbi:MAG: alkaline phosphatase family protein [Pirellulales bacterium]
MGIGQPEIRLPQRQFHRKHRRYAATHLRIERLEQRRLLSVNAYCTGTCGDTAPIATIAPFSPAPVAKPLTSVAEISEVDHVIHVSIEGLSAKFFQDVLESDAESIPNFVRLQNEGAFTLNARTDYSHVITLPNHFTMLTGRPVEPPEGQADSVAHWWNDNTAEGTVHSRNPFVDYVASTFDVAHDAGLVTRLYANKSIFSAIATSYDATNGAVDSNPAGGDNGRNKIDQNFITNLLGDVIDPFITALQATLAGSRTYSFLNIADLDLWGHGDGWGSSTWNLALSDVDGYLGQLLDHVTTNTKIAGNVTLVITASHGGDGFGHTDPTIPAINSVPVFVWGPGITPGADLYSMFSGLVVDPGEVRPDYNASGQPLRNGSTANLAMALLGLDPVPGSSIFVNSEAATVEGRHVFYNDSFFDDATFGNDDDTAIDPTKSALLPGQTATNANYISYTRGINGIMVDIANPEGTVDAADFEFHDMGRNGDTPTAAPAPDSITVGPGEGVGGSDRVVMTWDTSAGIVFDTTWLRVTVLESVGLDAADVFYFGSAPGEGSGGEFAQIDPADELGARNNTHGFGNPATVDDPWDYNKDRFVDPVDQLFARNNGTGFTTRLNLMSAPAAGLLSAGPFSAGLSSGESDGGPTAAALTGGESGWSTLASDALGDSSTAGGSSAAADERIWSEADDEAVLVGSGANSSGANSSSVDGALSEDADWLAWDVV